MGKTKWGRSVPRTDRLSLGVAVLTLATALIHLSLGISIGPPGAAPFPLLFYLNALGYLVLLIALYMPQLERFQRLIRWLLILYTAVTFALWFVLASHWDVGGYVDKTIEAALIILLIIDDWRSVMQSKEES